MTTPATSVEIVEGAVVFTDLVGFTEYTAVEGDAAAIELLSIQERIVTETLPAGARVVKELGDGLLVWFPTAFEAVRVSIMLQERFEDEADRMLLPLWVRMGGHWGHQAVRRNDLIGHDVNIASRIVDVAAPGEVLISEALCDAVTAELSSGIEFEELGPVIMKGIPEPVRLFRAARGLSI